MIESKRMRWAAHMAGMGEKRNAYRILVRKPKRQRPLEDLGIGGRIILKWILRDMGWGGVDWIDIAKDRDL
jgi:hypothetical protein